MIAGQLLSAVFMTAVVVATGESLEPLRADIWLVVLNGAFAAFAYTTHYKALELGPVAVVSPIGAGYAVVGVALAMIVLGERPSALASRGRGSRWWAWCSCPPTSRSSDMASRITCPDCRGPSRQRSVSASRGSSWAGSRTGRDGSRALGLSGRAGGLLPPLFFVFRTQLSRVRLGFGLWIALLAGAADILGVVAFSVGSERGLNSIVLAASAVFPLIAITLSVIVFKERMVTNQVVGVVLVVGGLLLLGLG